MLFLGVVVLCGLGRRYGRVELTNDELCAYRLNVEVVYREDVVGELLAVKDNLFALNAGLGLLVAVVFLKLFLIGSELNGEGIHLGVNNPVNLYAGVLDLNGLVTNGAVLNSNGAGSTNGLANELVEEGLSILVSLLLFLGSICGKLCCCLCGEKIVGVSNLVVTLSVDVGLNEACGELVLVGLGVEPLRSIEAHGVGNEYLVTVSNGRSAVVLNDGLNLNVGVGVGKGLAAVGLLYNDIVKSNANLLAKKSLVELVNVSGKLNVLVLYGLLAIGAPGLGVRKGDGVLIANSGSAGGAVDVVLHILKSKCALGDELVEVLKTGETELYVGSLGFIHLVCKEYVAHIIYCVVAEVERIVSCKLACKLLLGGIGNLKDSRCDSVLYLYLSGLLIGTEVAVGNVEAGLNKCLVEGIIVEFCVLGHIILSVVVSTTGKGEECHSYNKN